MNFIEQHEKSPRKWYAGAVGWFNFNGNLNTGLVLRTMRIELGIAEIRVGATLLYDSDPHAEEQETHLKASAFVDLLRQPAKQVVQEVHVEKPGLGKHVLLIDHQDSFVHTLANYIRQTGAEVTTVRSEHALEYLSPTSLHPADKPWDVECLGKHTPTKTTKYDLVLLSPGPGKPNDFNLSKTIKAVLAKNIPIFGVCLGLQGIVEYFGGVLDVLDYPVHGKPSTINVLNDTGLFAGFDKSFTAGRYHSLYARKEKVPKDLDITAVSEDGIVMAVSHRTLPVHAVQFHPETILTLPNQAGLRIINNVMNMVRKDAR
jgi:anthranilate synthase